MKTIAIIGGGFSGALTAVNLARFCEAPLRIAIVNHRFPLARGVAYSTRCEEHLLNVAARNMSALPDYPNHFVQWLQTRHDYADVPEPVLREQFLPRRVYGDYLRGLLAWYQQRTDGRRQARIDLIECEAVDIEPAGDTAIVVLGNGDRLPADKVLLATGNQPPAELPTARDGFVHPHYAPSPWDDWTCRLPQPHEDAILLGTGLTMVDALLTLLALGWQGTIHAVSRNGLLPLSHFKGIEYPEFPPPDVDSFDLEALVRLLRNHARRLRRRGANPAIVVDRLRPHTQRIWQRLSLADKRQFLDRYATRWNVVRHRVAQSIHEQVTAALDRGQLRVATGSINRLEAAGERIRVTITADDGRPTVLEAGLAINCTGPAARFTAWRHRLFDNLLARGLVQPDVLDMGLRVEPDFALVDGRGGVSPFLYAIGPPLKGTLWETTAVPELRGQAFRVAQTLLEACGAAEPALWPVTEEEPVLEYCI